MQQLFNSHYYFYNSTQDKCYSNIKSLIIKNITINHNLFPINIYHRYDFDVKSFKC